MLECKIGPPLNNCQAKNEIRSKVRDSSFLPTAPPLTRHLREFNDRNNGGPSPKVASHAVNHRNRPPDRTRQLAAAAPRATTEP